MISRQRMQSSERETTTTEEFNEVFTTKDTKITKVGVLIIRTLRALRGESGSSLVVFAVTIAKPNI